MKRYVYVYILKVAAIAVVLFVGLYSLHVSLSAAVVNYIVDRQVATQSLLKLAVNVREDDVLSVAVQNIVPRSDGKLEIQIVMSISDLLKQMDRVYGETVDETMLPRETSFLMHNEDLCKTAKRLPAIIYLHSAPKNTDRRTLIRATWGNKRMFKSSNFRVVFLVGLTHSKSEQANLEDEFKQHGDIVQGDFVDSYKNLTLKAIMGLKWIATYCSNAEFALKSDDDAFINIFAFLDLMNSNPSPNRLIACSYYIEGIMPVLRYPEPCSRWCVKYVELIGKSIYPRYCAGLAFLVSVDLMPALYEASRTTPFFWVDDVYVTGLLAEKVGGINYVQLGQNVSVNGLDAYSEYINARSGESFRYIMAHGHTVPQMLEMWQVLLRSLRPEMKRMMVNDTLTNVTRLLQLFQSGLRNVPFRD